MRTDAQEACTDAQEACNHTSLHGMRFILLAWSAKMNAISLRKRKTSTIVRVSSNFEGYSFISKNVFKEMFCLYWLHLFERENKDPPGTDLQILNDYTGRLTGGESLVHDTACISIIHALNTDSDTFDVVFQVVVLS